MKVYFRKEKVQVLLEHLNLIGKKFEEKYGIRRIYINRILKNNWPVAATFRERFMKIFPDHSWDDLFITEDEIGAINEEYTTQSTTTGEPCILEKLNTIDKAEL